MKYAAAILVAFAVYLVGYYLCQLAKLAIADWKHHRE